jgi:hypothetical protein
MMHRYLIFCAAFMAGCSPAVEFVGPVVPAQLLQPCAHPVKSDRLTEGAFAELAIGWRGTALCNEDRLRAVSELIEQDEPQ